MEGPQLLTLVLFGHISIYIPMGVSAKYLVRSDQIIQIFKPAEEQTIYRLISILPIFMKVFECAVHSQLYSFVFEYG